MKQTLRSVNIKKIVEEVVDRLKFTNKTLNWNINLFDINFQGIKEQWIVVIENILDNQIRYASERDKNIYGAKR